MSDIENANADSGASSKQRVGSHAEGVRHPLNGDFTPALGLGPDEIGDIEKLHRRLEIVAGQERMDGIYARDELIYQLENLAEEKDAEIERLRAEIGNLAEDIDSALRTITAENEENERLRARVAELEAENELHAQRLKDSHDIVARIWALFGTPSYADLKGKSIYDLITDLQAENAKLREAVTWRPIESVPDMQAVILFAYSADISCEFPTWKIATGYASGDEFIWDGRHIGPRELKPTLWLPLPEAPR